MITAHIVEALGVLFSIGCILAVLELIRLQVKIKKTLRGFSTPPQKSRALTSREKVANELLKALYDLFNFGPGVDRTKDVRCTIFIPEDGHLVQLTNYMPANSHGRGRPLPLNKGIVGEAFRDKRATVEFLNDPEAKDGRFMSAALMARWNFTDEDTQNISSDRRAYLAYPLVGENDEVTAIFYMDSNKRAAFDSPTQVESILRSLTVLSPFLQDFIAEAGTSTKPREQKSRVNLGREKRPSKARLRDEERARVASYTSHGWSLTQSDENSETFSRDADSVGTTVPVG